MYLRSVLNIILKTKTTETDNIAYAHIFHIISHGYFIYRKDLRSDIN